MSTLATTAKANNHISFMLFGWGQWAHTTPTPNIYIYRERERLQERYGFCCAEWVVIIMSWDWTNSFRFKIFEWYDSNHVTLPIKSNIQKMWCSTMFFYPFFFFFFLSLPLFSIPFLKVVHSNSEIDVSFGSLKVTLQKNHELSLGPNKWMKKIKIKKGLWYYQRYGNAQYNIADNSSDFGKSGPTFL